MILLSATTKSRIVSILLSTALFTVLVVLQALVAQRPIWFGLLDGLLIGGGVGFFEEFYVQGHKGRWMRSMHPTQSMLIYVLVVMWISVVAIHLSHLLLGQLDDLPRIYGRLPVLIPLFLAVALIGVGVIRVVHVIGIDTLYHLLAGTYFHPRLEAKVLMFLDINGSTALSARLGSFDTGQLVGKFIFDISKPITDHGGDIYLYKGDGLIAIWNWTAAIRRNAMLRAVDAIFAAVERESAGYLRDFGVVPSFRVGIHGGDVVVSEQGDLRRGIGIYGEVINVASRIEEAARTHRVGCVLSREIALAFDPKQDSFEDLGDEHIKGLAEPIRICQYRPRGSGPAERLPVETAGPAVPPENPAAAAE